MAKAKYKPSKAQGSMDPKKRKMQHFQRVSMSSPATATAATNQSLKKRKLGDVNRSQEQQQQQQIWKGQKKKNDGHQQELHQRPTIPYRKKDRILLIGEGDFSFARSLFEHHRCKNVFATCYDSQDDLLTKYHGQAETNIQKFLNYGDENEDDAAQEEKKKKKKEKEQTRKVLHSVDARKLGASVVGGGKEIRKGIIIKKRRGRRNFPWENNNNNKASESVKNDAQEDGPWDIISFNFPHVGGLSTDVNRQVRANQELLVAFFKACVPLLSRHSSEDDHRETDDYDDDYNYDYDDDDEEDTDSTSSEESSSEDEKNDNKIRTVPRHSGQIIVTLFEGEPYTLWNIKDLARHAGLVVVTSFKFPWKSYPGYSHARTLGVVESRGHHNHQSHHKSGGGGSDTKEEGRGGGWKGEDREARSFVFEVKKRESNKYRQQQGSKGGKKRGRGEEDDGDESSDGN